MKSKLLLPSFLGIILILSIMLYLFIPPERTRKILFFPETIQGGISGETRHLPRFNTNEKSVENLLSELLLGPVNIQLSPIFSMDTEINSILLIKNEIFIDFNMAAVLGTTNSILSFTEKIELVKKNLYFNFRGIDAVTVTIDGQVPSFPVYLPPGETGTKDVN
ncbi:MAG: GerMN domain-containing protein [Spirochaetia bacterium]